MFCISVTSVSDTGYWEGSVGDRDGWFPSEHVQEVRLRHKGNQYIFLTTLFDPEKQFSHLYLTSVSDTGYWEGSVGDRDGWFPSEYVQEVRLRHKGNQYIFLTTLFDPEKQFSHLYLL